MEEGGHLLAAAFLHKSGNWLQLSTGSSTASQGCSVLLTFAAMHLDLGEDPVKYPSPQHPPSNKLLSRTKPLSLTHSPFVGGINTLS
eukprot:scaffold256227_cov21-Tisochrysis_lutea.AAC.2